MPSAMVKTDLSVLRPSANVKTDVSKLRVDERLIRPTLIARKFIIYIGNYFYYKAIGYGED